VANFTPDFVLNKLIAGNQRYIRERMLRPRQTSVRRTQVAASQHPIAVLLGCSDSRALPEVIFDQGLGDLFVIRVAGHVADKAVVGSLEYAVEHLHVPLVMVLGHERCGAVKATLDEHHGEGDIPYLIDAIKPAVEAAKKQKGDLLDNAVIAHVLSTMETLKTRSKILTRHLQERDLGIAGARYDLDTGEVTILSSERRNSVFGRIES
jgi:carbonic anhydrase